MLCFKSIETEAIFTKTEMNTEGNINFLHYMRCVQKVPRLKLYLPKQKWTMNKASILFKTFY